MRSGVVKSVSQLQESGTGTVQPTEPLLKQKAEITDQIEKTEREMEEQQGKINEYVQRMNNVEDAIYADLSQKVLTLFCSSYLPIIS